MKHARLIWTGLAVLALAATAAFALTGAKSTHIAATSKTCSADMAAQCTAGMAATCGAKGAKAASAASASNCPMHATATAAATGGKCPYMTGAAKGAACDPATCPPGMCETKGARATAASAAGCAMHGTAATAAAAGCCAGKGAKAATAAAGGCAMHGGATAAAVDCEACADQAACESDIAEAGGKVQIVPLKNGLMYVYSAESSAKVRMVQAAVARHAERVAALGAAVDKAHLCSDCKEMRGAVASGKLTREVVNIENGCLTLVTSNDPHIVSRLYALAGVQGGTTHANVKS